MYLEIEFGTPLHVAASCGHLEVCKLILQHVQDKNPADYQEWTPLHSAAMSGLSWVIRAGKCP